MKNKNLIFIGIGLVALLIGCGVSFFAGTKYQQSKTPNRQFTFNNNGAFMGRGNGMGMGRFGSMNANVIRGQIINKDDKSITVKMTDGSTKIVILGSNTTIAKNETGSVNDLTNDASVTIFGNTNSDGSVTATNIQIGNIPFGPRPSEVPVAQ